MTSHPRLAGHNLGALVELDDLLLVVHPARTSCSSPAPWRAIASAHKGERVPHETPLPPRFAGEDEMAAEALEAGGFADRESAGEPMVEKPAATSGCEN